jgi:transportin-3
MQLLSQVLEYAPDIFFETSDAFETAFRAALAALTLIQSDIIFASLELIREILTHDCLSPPTGTVPPPKFPIYAAAIQAVIEKDGFELVSYLLLGLVGDFPEDSCSTVIAIFRMLAALWPARLLSWLPMVLQRLPAATVTDQAKSQFMSELTR